MQIRGHELLLAFAALSLPVWALETTGSFDRTLNVTGPVDLEVQNGSGGVIVRAGDAGTVRIHATIRMHDGSVENPAQRIREVESNPPVFQTGNSVRIGPIQDEWLRRHISISYEITTPRQTRLRSRTGSGRQAVEGIQGPVDVRTGSGGVSVSRIASDVRAETGSGGMELTSVEGRVDAHTGSGGIQASGVSGPITAQTGSGAVRLEQTTPGPVEARTGSGGVTVDQPITLRGTMNRHELRGQIRGGGSLVRVSTGSGSVRIQ